MHSKQRRRSDGTLYARRDQLEWQGSEFRILSIDGGGIKGIFPAAVLAECEKRFLKSKSCAGYFDLIAGTSTGGIIALGLGHGLTAREALELYLENGGAIFPKRIVPRIPFGKALSAGYQFLRDLAVYRYEREPLEKVLRDNFGNALLGDVNTRLNIPTFDGFNEVNVLKTPHHPDFKLDWKEEIVTAALATSAAPTFFSAYRNGSRHFADGGVWANNPVMVALVDAMTCFDLDRHNISILSLGCGDQDLKMSDGQIKWGGLIHWRTIIESAMHLQSQSALGQAGLLIGRHQLLRMSVSPTLGPIALDDFERARNELPKEAQRMVEENAEQLEEFFDAPRFAVDFYHGSRKVSAKSS
ncbi:CBASS cGAMP-activated phospholipase [Thalassospira marina]|uniref:Patatin n=1 Tax=Thalassospira marina TaxID=2048283 RepID=A0A2N3KYE9_9PROT|nr:CBASS cGAMP-activated phospholipase [Thalassospira marina]PKR55604.1 patatin [Thalassospira marina]